jgi:thiol-disulfide isomerase/thioredoxin
MLTGVVVRAILALILGAASFAAWKLLGRAVLARARRASDGSRGAPEGFVLGRPGLLVFGSPHCAPCVHAQKPAAHRLEREFDGAIQVIEVDVTERPGVAERYGIVSLPTVFVFDAAGAPRRVNHGLVSTEELRRQISPFLA